MWKYVTRRIKDTIERSANYFDLRSTTGVANNSANNYYPNDSKKTYSLCRWYRPRKCGTFEENNNTNNSRNFEQLNYSWLGAITWSSALIFGWYASQLIHLKFKYQKGGTTQKYLSVQNFFYSLSLCKKTVVKKSPELNDSFKLQKAIESSLSPVILLSNDNIKGNAESIASGSSKSSSDSNDLGDVLNSIENRLGLASIENGQHQEGLNLLRSAANRNHAPALYNLGLCYELGLGVSADEKLAMELYRSAATLEHPGALYNLGIYYGQGRGGLPKDTTTAARLLRLAAAKGQEDAITALKTLEIENENLRDLPVEHWASAYGPCRLNTPLQTSLFIENVNLYKQTQFNCEATVY